MTLEEIVRRPFEFKPWAETDGAYRRNVAIVDEAIDRMTNTEFLSAISDALEEALNKPADKIEMEEKMYQVVVKFAHSSMSAAIMVKAVDSTEATKRALGLFGPILGARSHSVREFIK